ncbi:MAG: YdeI/OmpD-associated family protein [Planctomycetota bacterium]
MRVEYFARDRPSWRRWLSRNHAKKSEVLLVFYKKATGVPCIAYHDAVEEALCFGWIDGIKQRKDDERYTFRFTPRRPKSNWSDSNRKRVKRLIADGLMQPAGLAAVEAAKKNGMWAAPTAATAPAKMPAELESALGRSAPARRAYESLTPGRQRQWQRWVGEAKRADTRERRAKKAVEQLRSGIDVPIA